MNEEETRRLQQEQQQQSLLLTRMYGRSHRQHEKVIAPIGLINSSGTACYINAALLLLSYTCTPIVSHYILLQSYGPMNHGKSSPQFDVNSTSHQQLISLKNRSLDEYEYEFILLLQRILRGNCNDRVDPTRFYQSLLENPNPLNFRYTRCGDAVSTLIQLIHFLQQKMVKTNDFTSHETNHETTQPERFASLSPHFNMVDELLHSGKVVTVLTGNTGSNTAATTAISNYIHTKPTTTTTTASATRTNSTRTKVLKVRPLMNPIPIVILYPQQHHPDMSCGHGNTVFACLQDALFHAFCTERNIVGYKWSNTHNHIVDDDDDDDATITTTSRLHVLSFPPIVMLHLQRFTIKSRSGEDDHYMDTASTDDIGTIDRGPDSGRTCCTTLGTSILKPIEDSTSHIQIPDVLDMSIYMSTLEPKHQCKRDAAPENNEIPAKPSAAISVDTTSTGMSFASISSSKHNDDHDDNRYHLVGGILHIHDYDDTDEQPIGHYVTVVRKQVGEQQQWHVMDDEYVTPVSIEQVLLWLGGGWYTNMKSDNDDNDNGASSQLFARGIVLVYDRSQCKPGLDESCTEWNEASLFGETSFRKPKLSSPLQPDIPPASIDDNFPGIFVPTMAQQVTTKSYWLDDSSDDDD